MPVSHVGLTVSHVPSACSFFLSALQPLGYRYVGNQGDSVGFGTDDADFFLSPETPGIARSNAHVAFSATSRSAVRDFYAAALTAGGQPNGAPACRGCNDYIFNAAVLDLDGNSIEVIYHQVDDDNRYTTVSGGSRVLTWRRGIVNVLGDEDRTTFVSARRNQSDVESISPSSVVETTPRSNAPSVTKSPSMPAVSTSGSEPGFQITGKAIIGTILGAAAGAAVAYAMVKSEQDSAQQEADFAEAMSRKSASSRAPSKAPSKMVPSEAQTNKAKTVLSSATTSKTAKASRVPEKNAETAAPRPRTRVHRNYSTTDSVVASRVMEQFSDVESEVPLRSHKTRSVRAIEAAPEPQPIDSKSYHSPTYVSLAPTSRASKKPEQSEAVYLPASRAVVQNPQPGQPSVAPIERQIEYVPASGASHLERSLALALSRRRQASTLRNLTLPAANAIDFSSNDFLSLSNSSALRDLYLRELAARPDFPLGSGGSRLLDGNSKYAEALEKDIATFHGAEDGLLCNSGFDANAGLFSVLPQPGDIVVYDSYIHASVHDGMRASRAGANFAFIHNSVEDLRAVLKRCIASDEKFRSGRRSIFIAVEAIYSMDGDVAPLKEIVEAVNDLLPNGNGHIIVDEAHSTGVLGPRGRGLVSALGLEDKITIRLHTFGKAMACNGAIILCSPLIKHYLVNYARPLIYTTFLSFPALAAIRAAYTFLWNDNSTALATHLFDLISILHESLFALTSSLPQHQRHLLQVLEECPPSPIFSVLSSDPRGLAKFCQEKNFMVRPIVPPTVPLGSERIRVCLHAGNTRAEVEALVARITAWVEQKTTLTLAKL
ncbi:PLP-dependent transferase, partial [Aureobasidium melanogenum]